MPVGAQLAGRGDTSVERLAGDNELGAEVADLVSADPARQRQAAASRPSSWRPSVASPPGASRYQPCGRALRDEVALEFGESGEAPKHEFAGGSCGIDRGALAGTHLQPDATGAEVVDGGDEVVQVAPEAFELWLAQPLRIADLL